MVFSFTLVIRQESRLAPKISPGNLAFYEIHNVNTPPFMAGMKRYPLKRC
jgi:hypothetical protein